MTLNKKILAAAIVGGLFATAANSQAVNLTPTAPATTVPAVFASEIIMGTNGTRTLTNLGNSLDIQTNLRYNFSEGEVRFARVECSSNVRFATGAPLDGGASAALAAGSGAGTDLAGSSIGSINGLGTNVITFSITSGSGLLKSGNTLTVAGNRVITSTAPATCSYSLYDTPSQAAAGGEAGRITTVSANYLTFAPTYAAAVISANGAVANVEANPSFSRFTAITLVGSNVGRANLGQIRFDTRAAVSTATGGSAVQPRIASGATATLAEVLAAAGASGPNHVITGDFAGAANANGTFTGTAVAQAVFFDSDNDCDRATGTQVDASAVTATSARFNTGPAAVNGSLCYVPQSASFVIPASTYSLTFNAVSRDTALYTTPGIGPVALGSITRNGTSLQAQLVQIPAGWISRIVLTNTGSVARPYTIAAQTEAGVTATLGTAATGTIPANGTIVLNTADIATFTGTAPRGTLNVTVAGPTNDIQGLYQIVNAQTGSIANTALVRPGTN